MQLAHRAALNGVQLDEVDPRIIIQGIEGGAGKEVVSAIATGSGDGMRVTERHREYVECGITFSILARRNQLAERTAVLEAACAWAARGGWLTVNYKPDRRLYVDEVVMPGEGDVWNRDNMYTITMRARAIPFWQNENAVSGVTGSGGSGSGSLIVPGSARTVADAVLRNVSGATINSASITIGGQGMSFSGLDMGNGESLVVDHLISSGKNIIRIRVGGRSAMACRSGADDFLIMPGNVGFSFSAQRACQLTVSVRGRFA